jgi:hypothetical protein
MFKFKTSWNHRKLQNKFLKYYLERAYIFSYFTCE